MRNIGHRAPFWVHIIRTLISPDLNREEVKRPFYFPWIWCSARINTWLSQTASQYWVKVMLYSPLANCLLWGWWCFPPWNYSIDWLTASSTGQALMDTHTHTHTHTHTQTHTHTHAHTVDRHKWTLGWQSHCLYICVAWEFSLASLQQFHLGINSKAA